MLGKLLKFELGFQIRQIGFWVTCIVMFALGVLSAWLPDIFGSSLAGQKIKINGAQMIAGQIASWDIAAIFFGAIFVVTGILRDKTYNMLEIVHGTPVSTFNMTSSRMIGIYLTILACIFSNTLGQFVGQFNPQIDPEIVGPVNPLYYLQPMVLFTVFNALVITAFFTLIAGITQNRMLVFVSAVGLFFYSIMTGMIVELDPPKWIQAIVDPFANIAYTLDTEFWAPEDRNTKLTPVLRYVGLNRLVWGVISLLILWGVFGRFKRGLVTGKTKLKKDVSVLSGPITAYKPVHTRDGFLADISAFMTRVKFEYLATVKSVPFIILAGLAATLFAVIIILTVFFSPTKLVPTSLFMATFGFSSFLIPIVLIIAFFSGEMIWRDKTAKYSELLDSTPVRNWPLLLSKWLALFGVLITLCLVAIIIGMAVQFLSGGPPIDVALYFKYAFLNVLPRYIALAIIALFVQMFTPNRVVGMLAAAAAMVFFTFLITRLPFYHPLIGFTGTSPGSVSEISPYNDWISFRWFNLYTGALSALFAVIGVWLWRRGLQTSLRHRLRQFRQNITPISTGVAALFLAIFIGSGIKIYKAHNDANWMNAKTTEKMQVAGEKLFAAERELSVPTARTVMIDADIYPRRQEATVKGEITFENASSELITEVYVNSPTSHYDDIRTLSITGAEEVKDGQNADGDAISQIHEYDVRVFKFSPPLAPGAKTALTYDIFFRAPSLADPSVISKNGTFINNYADFAESRRVVPTLGVPDLRIRNSKKRRKYGLDELEPMPDRTDVEAQQKNIFGIYTGPTDFVDFEGRVCTSENQIPIAPGEFIGETVNEGRRCRSYKSARPINNFYSLLSGEYAVTEDSWMSPTGKIIPIRVYHGKNHTYGVDNMIQSAKFGLSHYSEKFSPYQYNYFRIMEVPFIGFAQAFAGTIPYAEAGFIMDSGDPDDVETLDNAGQTTLHELAHQWFGHQIVPSQTRGNNVLVEGLTSYAALDAYEEIYGWDKARYALEKSGMGIESMQAMALFDREKEVPLAVAGEQRYLFYAKADWVMWGLKHYIGREKMYDVMKSFIAEFGSNGPPYPTTLDVVSALKEAAGPDYHQLIDDYWERITWWELAYGEGDPKVLLNSDGTYTVSVPFKLDKKISTEAEPEQISVTEIDDEALNEWIEIGFYKNQPKDKWSDWSALERVRVNQSESTLSFVVKERPSYVALDPRRLLQERNATDNVKELDKGKLASNE